VNKGRQVVSWGLKHHPGLKEQRKGRQKGKGEKTQKIRRAEVCFTNWGPPTFNWDIESLG